MPQINHISLKLPNVPALSQPNDIDPSILCNLTTHPHCKEEFCHCTHMLQVGLGSLVEIILVDRGIMIIKERLHSFSYEYLFSTLVFRACFAVEPSFPFARSRLCCPWYGKIGRRNHSTKCELIYKN